MNRCPVIDVVSTHLGLRVFVVLQVSVYEGMLAIPQPLLQSAAH